ncbi:unnamed protein product, partial [Allacma fusca]
YEFPESYESTGEEANVLDSTSNAIGTTVERKNPYHDAAAGAAGTTDDSSPKSLTLAVDNPASVPNQNIWTCYYRTVPYEENELTFVYIKTMGKTVNINISRIPWLIQRLVYYYSLKSDNMQALGQALENCVSTYAKVASEIEEAELDI